MVMIKMAGYLPLDRELLNSTLWITHDSDVRSLWVYLLLSADMNTGIVNHSLPAIANANPGISVEKVRSILEELRKPDTDSRSKDNDGRRIEYVDPDNPNGGIIILNYAKYKEKFSKGSSAERMRRKRLRDACDVTVTRVTSFVTKEKEKEKEKNKELKDLPDSSESVSDQIYRLSKRYDLETELLDETRESCALSRKNGTMSDSVWLKLLQKLDKHPIESVLSAMSIYTEKHADGEKSENYLMGIVRGETKRLGSTRRTKRAKPQDVKDAERILSTATETYPSAEEKAKYKARIDLWQKEGR